MSHRADSAVLLDLSDLRARYQLVRARSGEISKKLSPEDCAIQSMSDASPVKWHLAHTSWFFETFILAPHVTGYRHFEPEYGYLFNSYYKTVGMHHPRPDRGLLSRPELDKVISYRQYVDHSIIDFLDNSKIDPAHLFLLDLGLHHEQQHQELMLTDVKHLFSQNPLLPAYDADLPRIVGDETRRTWVHFQKGLYHIGHEGDGFAFDNEMPRHEVYLRPFEINSHLVTVGDYLSFVEDDGYLRPDLWLSDGWDAVQANQWAAPMYWRECDGDRQLLTLGGLREVDPDEPVTHVSYYEAEAFARWSNARLPGEAEWEVASNRCDIDGNFAESGFLHPTPTNSSTGLCQFFGDVWEWTGSPYAPYPSYKSQAGALGEYNGKFMCNQYVLRGGSCVTPHSHIRSTYRNFFAPDARWQFSGIRLARDSD